VIKKKDDINEEGWGRPLERKKIGDDESRDGSIGIATGYGVRFPAERSDFSLLHSVQLDSEAHPAVYPMGTGDFFPRGKAAECRVQELWRYNSTPRYVLIN
jgi:hypothetical protein